MYLIYLKKLSSLLKKSLRDSYSDLGVDVRDHATSNRYTASQKLRLLNLVLTAF